MPDHVRNYGPVGLLDITSLVVPDLLDRQGHLQLLSDADYRALDPNEIRFWCHLHARYGLPTLELIYWLKDLIGDRTAIEIGAGHGDLAHRLQIPAIDNWSQTFPDVVAHYNALNQPLIHYPDFVERLEATDALVKYKPEVVVASWVTQWCDPRLPYPEGGGSIYGVKEDELLDSGVTYVLIGNTSIHGQKKILKRPHQELALPFLWSRSLKPELNRIWIWN